MESGRFKRTPLVLKMLPAQKIDKDSITPGWHSVTGGEVNVNYQGEKGGILRVLGIKINNPLTPIYDKQLDRCDSPDTGQQLDYYDFSNPTYGRNFAYILYELKMAGIKQVTKINMDYHNLPIINTKGQLGTNMKFINSCLLLNGPHNSLPVNGCHKLTFDLMDTLANKNK